MPFWKQLLLSLYYHGTYPVRACNSWREASRGHLPIVIFCFHRIAEDGLNQWTTSNSVFVRQMQWLGKRFRFISLEETQRRIRSGVNREPCVSITFDDGYADNCRFAIPWLLKERIPCTYFVTVQNVMAQEAFAHDKAMGHHIRPNTVEQLQHMAAAGIEVAAHAYNHRDLATVSECRQLEHEVVDARKELEAAIHRPVRYFAFPYGLLANLNPTVFKIAHRAGYEAVCSAYGGFNYPADDAFHLRRIVVDDDMIRLKNWATMDPRKLHTPKFDYSLDSENIETPITQPKESAPENNGTISNLGQPGNIPLEQFIPF